MKVKKRIVKKGVDEKANSRIYINIEKNIKGSITIEAAIILPFVIIVCLIIFTLSSFAYKHVRVQTLLNQVCVELSYDSYMFDELGVVKKVQDINKSGSYDKLTIEEIQDFRNNLSQNSIQNIKSKLGKKLEFNNPSEFIEAASNSLEILNESLELGGRIKETSIEEGLYFMTTSFGRKYVENKLDDYLEAAGLDIDYTIEHLELFNYDYTGVVLISYEVELPFGLIKNAKFKEVNSGYIHLYSGHGDYNEMYHKDIETSSYGSGNGADENTTDEDGYAKKVYITEHGSKYHVNPLCFHIKVNAISVPLSMVKDKKPCSYCVDEGLLGTNSIVFTTLASDVYHSSPTCHSIFHNIRIMSEKEALYNGYSPCGTCSK